MELITVGILLLAAADTTARELFAADDITVGVEVMTRLEVPNVCVAMEATIWPVGVREDSCPAAAAAAVGIDGIMV